MSLLNNRDNRCSTSICGTNQSTTDKVCILTTRVFDSGLSQIPVQDISITLTRFNPAGPTYPLTFVGCSTTGSNLTLNNLVIDRFDDRPCFARITASAVVPVTILYTDANGVEGTATGTYTVPLDVVMSIPQPSVVPFTVTGYGVVACQSGTISADGVLTLTGCITIILRVVAETQLIVPTYGYCTIPEAVPFALEDTCPGTTGLPLFPTCGN